MDVDNLAGPDDGTVIDDGAHDQDSGGGED